MRLRTLLTLATLLSLAASWLLWKDLLRNSHLVVAPVPPTARERQLGYLLTPERLAFVEQRVPSPLVLNSSLARAIEDLRRATGYHIFVNWKSLEQVGVTRDTCVSLDVSGLPFADAMRQLLDYPNPAGTCLVFDIDMDLNPIRLRGPPQGHPPQNPVVIVTTHDDVWRDTDIHVYDVRDLLTPLLGNASSSPSETDADPLIRRITTTVHPESWKAFGDGSRPPIRFLSGQLIITQNAINQRDIACLLHELRQTRRIQMFGLRATLLTLAVAFLVTLTNGGFRYYVAWSGRRHPDLCRHCGYDLRASPDRCPECGTNAPAKEPVTI